MRGDLEWGSIPGLVRCGGRTVRRRRGGRRRPYAASRTRSWAPASNARRRPVVANGVEPGDRVAIWAPNTLDWIVSALGAVSAGAVLVPLNTRFKGDGGGVRPGPQPGAAAVRDGDVPGHVVRGVAAAGRAGGRRRGPAPGLPHLEQVVVLSDDAPADFRTWKDFLAGGDGVDAAEVRERAAAVGRILPLGHRLHLGHDGPPQGCGDHPRADAARRTRCGAISRACREGDRYLIVNPFFHTFGYKAGRASPV